MRIERATLYHVELPLVRPFVCGFGEVASRGELLVKLESADHAGWGTAPHLPFPTNLPEFMAGGKALLAGCILPAVVGKELSSPRHVAECWGGLRGNNISKSAVEMAAWDLFAVAAGLPLFRYIHSAGNTAEVGASIGIAKEDEVLAAVKRAVQGGYKRVKIKISPGADVEVVKLIRRHCGDIPLMVDCNSSYTLAQADVLKALDGLGLMMIEQPLAYDDIVDHARLQGQLATPICLDESITSAADARKAIELGSCRIINIKPGRVGGIAESLEILALCRRHGLGAWIGGMLESAVGKAALAHVATAEGVSYPSDLTPGSCYLKEDIAPAPLPDRGVITLGDRPGIGVAVDEALLAKYCQEKTVLEA